MKYTTLKTHVCFFWLFWNQQTMSVLPLSGPQRSNRNVMPVSSPQGSMLSETTQVIAQKMESIRSDEPRPSSSENFLCPAPITPTIPKFNLEETYPSIFIPTELIRLLEGIKDLDKLRSLTQVFTACLQSIIRSVDGLLYDIRLNPIYERAQQGVIFTWKLFTAQVTRIDPDWCATQAVEGIEMALELMDMTIASLRSFLEIVERITTAKKPLPALPRGDLVVPAPLQARSDLNTLPNSATVSPLTAKGIPESSLNERINVSCTKPSVKRKITDNTSRRRESSIIHRILQLAPNPSNISISSTTNSSLTAVDPRLPTKPLQEPEKCKHPELPYVLRQSAVYFPADPYCPEVDVEMPLPAGDAVAVRLDHLGMPKAASLTALVRMLTSKDAVIDPEFTDTFFLCFRLFSSPMQFFQRLVERFDEIPPASLTTAQLRIWMRESTHVRIRVGKTIKIWMAEYWRPEHDNDVLKHLQTFVLERMIKDLPNQLAMGITKGLNDLVNRKEHRGIRRKRQLDIDKYLATVDESGSTDFDLLSDPDVTPQLSQFKSRVGREALARQLTIKASEIFFKIDPEAAVIFWTQGKDKEVGQAIATIISFERSMSMWVTSVILDQPTQSERADMIEFWLDVSTVSYDSLQVCLFRLDCQCVVLRFASECETSAALSPYFAE
jgi:hypothetical protein